MSEIAKQLGHALNALSTRDTGQRPAVGWRVRQDRLVRLLPAAFNAREPQIVALAQQALDTYLTHCTRPNVYVEGNMAYATAALFGKEQQWRTYATDVKSKSKLAAMMCAAMDSASAETPLKDKMWVAAQELAGVEPNEFKAPPRCTSLHVARLVMGMEWVDSHREALYPGVGLFTYISEKASFASKPPSPSAPHAPN